MFFFTSVLSFFQKTLVLTNLFFIVHDIGPYQFGASTFIDRANIAGGYPLSTMVNRSRSILILIIYPINRYQRSSIILGEVLTFLLSDDCWLLPPTISHY